MKRTQNIIRFAFNAIACVGVKLLVDFIALVLKTGVVAMWDSLNHINMAAGTIQNFVAIAKVDAVHVALEGIFIAIFVWLSKDCHMKTSRYNLVGQVMIILLASASFELVDFMSSLIQFVGNGIWSAVTSSAPSVTLRNNIAVSRWANIDYLFRLCEGWLVLKVLQLMQALLRYKAKKERE